MVENTDRSRGKAGFGAAILTLSGMTAAFGLASCCALPMLLAGAGLSAAWLGGLALLVAPHRPLFLGVGIVGLLGGAALLWRQQRHAATCDPNDVRSPVSVRVATLIGLMVGTALLWAGFRYA